MQDIHTKLFPARGCRTRITDVPDFPENDIQVKLIDIPDDQVSKVDQAYGEIREDRDSAENPLVRMLRGRQISELYKVPYIISETEDLVEDGHSVVIMVNFSETLLKLRQHFKTAPAILGGQNDREREEAKQKFQTNTASVLIMMIQCGGVGLSLGDEAGNHPRVALICPPLEVVQLKQSLGRVHRVNSKSKCRQQILVAAGTIEETEVAPLIKVKLTNLDLLHDGLLTKVTEDIKEGMKKK